MNAHSFLCECFVDAGLFLCAFIVFNCLEIVKSVYFVVIWHLQLFVSVEIGPEALSVESAYAECAYVYRTWSANIELVNLIDSNAPAF